MTIEEFIESMQVKVDILNEQKREREIYERGVKAMKDAQGIEASDYAVNSVTLANGVKWYNS